MAQRDPFSISEPGALGLLAKVIAEAELVHLHRDEDQYHAVVLRRIGDRVRRVSAVHPTLLGLLRCLEAGGKIEAEPKRKCPGCNLPRSYGQFSRDARGPAGLRRLCQFCERARVRAHSQKAAKLLAMRVLGEKPDATKN